MTLSVNHRGAVLFVGAVLLSFGALPAVVLGRAIFQGENVTSHGWMLMAVNFVPLTYAPSAWRGEPAGRWLLVVVLGCLAVGSPLVLTLEHRASGVTPAEWTGGIALSVLWASSSLILWCSKDVRSFLNRRANRTAPHQRTGPKGVPDG